MLEKLSFKQLPSLKKIDYDIGSHIRCLMFFLTNDTQSEKAGGFTLAKSVDFEGKQIGKIEVYTASSD